MLNIKSPKSGRLIFTAINLCFPSAFWKGFNFLFRMQSCANSCCEAAVITRGRIYFSPDSDCSSLIREIYLLTPPSSQTSQIFWYNFNISTGCPTKKLPFVLEGRGTFSLDLLSGVRGVWKAHSLSFPMSTEPLWLPYGMPEKNEYKVGLPIDT